MIKENGIQFILDSKLNNWRQKVNPINGLSISKEELKN